MKHFNRRFERLEQLNHLLSLLEKPKGNVTKELKTLIKDDRFWGFPGPSFWSQLTIFVETNKRISAKQWLQTAIDYIKHDRFRSQSLAPFDSHGIYRVGPQLPEEKNLRTVNKPYFEVLVIANYDVQWQQSYCQQLLASRQLTDEYQYRIVTITSIEDAAFAVSINPLIQVVVLHADIKLNQQSENYFSTVGLELNNQMMHEFPIQTSASALKTLRPELAIIGVTNHEETLFNQNTDVTQFIYHTDSYQQLHMTILNCIRHQFETPFFHALQSYAKTPKGVFHALPISRGSSIKSSHWINDFGEFYGDPIFQAETSSTLGGLDSLLDPKGPIKQAQDKAAETFGAKQTYFVTNGTSTSNKIITQSLLQPDDYVIVASDCHKSICYSVLLSGAHPILITPYTVDEFTLYGAVELIEIKKVMLKLRKAGQLDRLKLIILTSATFDGVLYHTERFMSEILALKPDMIFHWDEAWFSYAHFSPIYHDRHAMSVARRLSKKCDSETYQKKYKKWAKLAKLNDDDWVLNNDLLPDPSVVKLRVYSSQSTHKTLTSFRQGSMIHVWDDDFNSDAFVDAYYTHTSTSPNYQILASLDVGRRQVALEGYDLVTRAINLGVYFRKKVIQSIELQSFFSILEISDIVPSAQKRPFPEQLDDIFSYWKDQEFVVDLTRITLDVSRTGLDGESFRHLLMNRFDIQVNKTSRQTILFIFHIGMTKELVDYLIDVLASIAQELSQEKTIEPLEQAAAALPKKRLFPTELQPLIDPDMPLVNLRKAYFMAHDAANIEYIPLSTDLLKRIESGERFISASFVTPYPPGFPLLVPGQIITAEILKYLIYLNIKEIHGLDTRKGLKTLKMTMIKGDQNG